MSISLRSKPATTREISATFRLALPIVLSQLAMIGESVVGMMMAGHLGARVLGAVGLGVNVWMVGLMVVIGVMMAIPPSVAQLDGAGRRAEVGGLARQAMYLGLAIGILVQLLFYFGAPSLLPVMGMDAELVAGATAFLHAVSFMAPALGLYMVCRGLSEGLSLPRLPLLLNLLGLLILAPIGYLFLYVLHLGAFGSGLATAVVTWLQLGTFAFMLWRSPAYRGLRWGAGRAGPDFAVIGGLLKLGLPMAFSVVMEVGMFSGAALVIGRFGETAIASHQIALNVASVTFMVPMGIAMAITVRVGNAVGRADRAGMRRAGLVGMGMALISQTAGCVLMLTLPNRIAGLYTNDAAVLSGAAGLLFLAALFQLSDGLQVACNGALRGMKDARVPMAITLLAYWGIGMPVGWFMAFPMGLRTPGMWIGLVAGLTAAAALLFARFLARSRRMPA